MASTCIRQQPISTHKQEGIAQSRQTPRRGGISSRKSAIPSISTSSSYRMLEWMTSIMFTQSCVHDANFRNMFPFYRFVLLRLAMLIETFKSSVGNASCRSRVRSSQWLASVSRSSCMPNKPFPCLAHSKFWMAGQCHYCLSCNPIGCIRRQADPMASLPPH